ncbi:DUF1963 domain-containing protein [bacterium]|nr:DUF1963 domain-containing protein [bacterium]
MSHPPELNLPPVLEPFREAIAASIRPYVEIQATPTKKQLPYWQSKFGGLPYLPRSVAYPKTPAGDYLHLLAQINFAEVPALEGFPQQGILQFYIASGDLYGLYGEDFHHPTRQSGFRVMYFAAPDLNVDALVTDFSFLPGGELDLPVPGCYALRFERQSAPISALDYRVGDWLQLGEGDRFWELNEVYCDVSIGDGHKLGGYPFFTQDDPRSRLPKAEEPYELLLQIDSGEGIMWGDVGVGNFFIRPSALERLDFSDVLYNWDCS